MGLISNLLKKILGDNHKQAETSLPSNDNYIARWDKEREERIIAAEERLKDWLVTSLREKGTLPFSWESGNDEAFVTFQDKDDSNEESFEDLEEYIIDKLDIPDAGEFQMNGSGTVYIENNLARAKYSSTMKATIDYNEETDEEIFSEEEQDSGDKVLFAI
jgi:hypothetical protein